MSLLSAEQRRHFELVVASALREGWLSPGANLIAERFGSCVKVAVVHGSSVLERTYPFDERWLFQLVRDLAWGEFSVNLPTGRSVAPVTEAQADSGS
jgi:hypothetical protein